jgi:hypothetical protein
MKMSGNSNANLFFKRHGVSELQMKSEKKYSTKAATEYKKHLQRALLDNVGANISRKDSVDSNDEKDDSVEWGADAGLDNLIKSVSGEDLKQKGGAESAAPASVFMSAAAAPASAQAPAPAPAPAVVLKKTPAAADIGSISVALGDASISSSTAASKGPIKVGTLGKGPKKSIAKKIGARKLTPSGGSDGALESFEKVEERTEAVTQEVEDHKLAVKLQNSENLQGSGSGGSSRLAAVYAEAESIYTVPTTQSSNSNSFSSQGSSSYNNNNNYNSGTGYNGGNGGAGNSRTATYGHLDKGDAQERFGKAKSISSESYWGQNKTDEREMQGRLNQYRGASGISSDMLNGTEDSRGRADSDDGLSALKDSVKDFFSQIG